MDAPQWFTEMANKSPPSATGHHPIAPDISPKGKEGQALSDQGPICEFGRPPSDKRPICEPERLPRNRRAPKRYNAAKGVWEWIGSTVLINCSHLLFEHWGDVGLSPIGLLLNYELCYYSWCYSYLCLYLRCQSLFWINVISEQQVFLYHTVPSIATFSQQSAFWPRLPQLTEGSLLRTELLATSTCLSIPYIFIVDHKDAKDCPVRECVICNYVSHSILIRFVID